MESFEPIRKGKGAWNDYVTNIILVAVYIFLVCGIMSVGAILLAIAWCVFMVGGTVAGLVALFIALEALLRFAEDIGIFDLGKDQGNQ